MKILVVGELGQTGLANSFIRAFLQKGYIVEGFPISPADLKKMPDFELSFILSELKLTSAKTGRVPRANASMVSAPLINPPVVSAYNCIDCVNYIRINSLEKYGDKLYKMNLDLIKERFSIQLKIALFFVN